MTIDFKALAAKAVASGADMTKSVAGGGGDYEAPAAGPALCRFVAYVETGKQVKKFKGVEQTIDEVQLVFELTGKRHPPREMEDGTKVPHRITIKEKRSLNEKANFFKLFNRMNYKQSAQHIAELLGEGYKCEVVHDKWTGADGKERTDVQLRNKTGYTIAPPRKEDEDSESGWVDVAVPAAISELKCFIWDHADMQQWGSIFIEGSYPERKDDKGVVTAKAKSKNVLQERIMSAKNFSGSPMHELLLTNGISIDLPDVGYEDEDDEGNAEAPASGQPSASGSLPASTSSTTPPSDDALGGIV